jgi:nicotinate-nucleotide adenylyltransferase
LDLTENSPIARRIGVFGGAFDPPHAAHVALAQAAIAQLKLDELHVMPTGQAWHKTRPLSPAHHRLAMLELAFADVPRVTVDPRETLRTGPTYTVDTLRELKAQWPDADIYLVIGEDQARALPSWHEWQDITRLAIICVAERENTAGSKPDFIAPGALESQFRRLHLSAMPISATDIRARISAHTSVVPLVFEPVARYIDRHHLYQTI